MADKRISQLVERVTLLNNDVFPIVASGAATTNKVTLQTIDDYMQTNLNFGVTSVAMTVPTGLSVTGTPITSTGTFIITFTAGYSIPTTAKQTQWDTAYNNRIVSVTAPITFASNVLGITQSGAASDGYLSSTDWNTFNNKQAALTFGNLTEATSSVLTITGGTGAVIGSGTTIQVTQANGSQDGFLDSADWTTFNGKQNALTGTGIVKSTGGTITYLTDNTSNWDSAYNDKINSAAVTGTTTKTLTLTQQDGGTITTTWTDLDTGTVTSVGVSMPSAFSVANSPITSSGTIAITGAGLISQYIDGTGALQTFPSGLPPTGAAGGDLQGTYPNPTVHRVHGIDLQSGTPTADDVWVYGGSPAKWQHQKLHSNQVTEDGNLFYTDARARASISESVTGLDYNSTTGVLSTSAGYGIPTTASQTTWDAAYNDKINSAAVTGTTTKTLTLNQQDGGTITASWTDINTDAVTSVFGRTGAVVATNGDYNTDQVTEGSSNLYFTNARSRSSISLTTTGTSGAATYNSTTGVLNIPSYVGGVTSVNTLTGAVVLTTSNIAEGTNLYYTNARARGAISLTTTGTSGAATYDSATGVLNVPQYSTDLSGYVPTSRTLTINGTSFDLSANRTWTIATANTLQEVILNNGLTNTGFTIQNANSTYSTPASTNVPVIYMHNTGANANAHAVLSLRTLGGTGGDPFISLDINGVLGWHVGVDNSDADKFKIGKDWATVGTNTYFTIDTSGNSTFSNNVNILDGSLVIKTTAFGGQLALEAGSSTNQWLMYHYNPDNTLRFNYNGAGGDEFIMATNGATTFSNSVTAAQFLASSSGNAAIITSTGVGGYGLVAVGSAGTSARDILLAGHSGYSNGFTVQYTGSAMQYTARDGNFSINNGRLILNTAGVNTYGLVSGYTNSNHLITLRANITGPTASPTFTADHLTCFVEYAEPNDTTGWFFKTSHTTNYTEVARITRAGIYHQGSVVWTAANDGSGSGLDADLLDGRDSGGYMTQIQGGIEFPTGSYTGWYKLARSSQATNGAGLRGGFKIIVAQTGNYLNPTQDIITGFKNWTTELYITSVESAGSSIFQNYRLTYDADYTYLEGYVSYYFGGSQSIVINSYVNGLNGLTWSPYTGTAQASSTSSGATSIGKVGTGLAVPYLRSSGGGIFTGFTEWVGDAGDDVGLVRINNTKNGGGVHYPALLVMNQYGNHSYGIVAEFRIYDTSTGDRPSILFSRGSGANWAIGMGATSGNSDNFRIGYKGTYLLDSWATMRMDMDTSGNVTFAGDVTAYSDIRLKKDIQVIENPIEKVKKIRGVTFKRNDEIDDNIGRKHTGVIAQEVLDVLPEVVSQNDTGMYNVAYGNMVGLLIEAIKEQQKEIDNLKKQIA